eukprot:jgi/Mesvir1/1734/Mv21186-RA.1
MVPTSARNGGRFWNLLTVAIICARLGPGFLLAESRAEQDTHGEISPRQAAERRDESGILRDLILRYYDNAQLEAYLKGFVQRCGHIAQLRSIGKSVDGVDLWVVELSDQPGHPEPEPGVKLVGGVHGDEPLGRQLLLAFAEYLCGQYGVDDEVTRLVRGLHVFLLPALNPDGFKRHTRGNAAGRDLNRDFPDQFRGGLRPVPGRHQPETLAVMNFSLSHRTVVSASFHEGALVANYPWDGTPDGRGYYAACPDDAAFRLLAETYARAHPLMHASREFAGGITNGAAWYPLWGGMQDWNYLVAGSMDITVEMCDTKWPPAATLSAQWQQHRPSMMALLAHAARSGVRGTVTSAARGGAPLRGATVRVAGIAHDVSAGQVFGDYYRLLAPGTYTLTASAPGHAPASATVVVPPQPPGLSITLVTAEGARAVPNPAPPDANATALMPLDGTVVNFVLVAESKGRAASGAPGVGVLANAGTTALARQGTGAHLVRGAASGPSPPGERARRTRVKQPPELRLPPPLAGGVAVPLPPVDGVGAFYLQLRDRFERQRMAAGRGQGVVVPLGLAGHVVRTARPVPQGEEGGGGTTGGSEAKGASTAQQDSHQGVPLGADASIGHMGTGSGTQRAAAAYDRRMAAGDLSAHPGPPDLSFPPPVITAAIMDMHGRKHELVGGMHIAYGMMSWVAISFVCITFLALVVADKRLIHRRALLRMKRGASK